MVTTPERHDGFRTAEVIGEDRPLVLARSRTAWGAIWAGSFTAFAIEVLFTILLVGVFANLIRPGGGSPTPQAFGIGIAVWLFLETLLANYAGGWLAGRLAALGDGGDPALHGFTVWSIVTLAMFALAIAPSIAGSMQIVLGAMSGAGVSDATATAASWFPIFVFVTLAFALGTATAGARAAAHGVMRASTRPTPVSSNP